MQENIRALVGWMDEDEGIRTLLGQRYPHPNEDITEQRRIWQAARERVLARGAFNQAPPELGPVPAELEALHLQFAARADIIAAFQPFDWSVGIAPLRAILSYQKTVSESAVERASGVDITDAAAVFRYCLPEAATPVPQTAQTDLDGKGVSMSSLNPNLRVFGFAAGVHNGQNFMGFAYGFGTNVVQIAEYQGRWFVRDGYHRCYGLLRRGVEYAPCVFIRASNTLELGSENPAFFRHELLFGTRPPALTDFLNDDVARSVTKPAMRKVIRFSAQEFLVEV